MTPAQNALIDRVRELLAGESMLREVSMFGGRAFMVDEKMIVSALKDGGLLVRVPTGRHDEFLGEPGAAQAEMGAGRTMGPGWVDVAEEAIRGEKCLAYWVGVAMDHNRVVHGKS
ncbi:TfoX/Sxy family protein [Rhodococcus artemisiae]|uniref:TfoX/Sxy family protein n=1 Tax=Rhodococcus artemisiae TaxID=714159 RepID=A0ABU7LDW7_9NOCA|nr:TfoX/Sxy family protein [Rhodococcus artemisiae]MEE2059750.1 TfoX/Sxy family protein [Rhodococcus artemisiae]